MTWCALASCHGVLLLACVMCHVYLLACVSWCVLVGLCVMVCTCWLVCHGVYLLGSNSVSWLVFSQGGIFLCFSQKDARTLKGQTLTTCLCDCGLFDMTQIPFPLCATLLWYIVQHPKDVMLHPMGSKK